TVRPLDPRLTRLTTSARRSLIAAVALGCVTAALVIAQAWLLATAVAGAFTDHETLHALRAPMVALLVVVFLRALVAWYSEVAASRASATGKSQLRGALVERLAPTAPRGAGAHTRPHASP